jgi:hypothetical protein
MSDQAMSDQQAEPESYASAIWLAMVVALAYLGFQVCPPPPPSPPPPPVPVQQPAPPKKHFRLFPFPHFEEEYYDAPIDRTR